MLRNQVRAGLQPARTWFKKLIGNRHVPALVTTTNNPLSYGLHNPLILWVITYTNYPTELIQFDIQIYRLAISELWQL